MAESKTGIYYPDNILEAIQPEVDIAYQRHLDSNPRGDAISLNPYELVPIQDYEMLRQTYVEYVDVWAERGMDIEPLIQAVMLIDTATEDNLPYYTAVISAGFESLSLWNRRWTAEEGSHGEIMIREMEARGLVDMANVWQPLREKNKASGIHINIETPADGLAYVATQELLTKNAHFASGRVLDAPAQKNLRVIAADEGRHYQFYINALRAVAKIAPDYALAAMKRQHAGKSFDMPGHDGIENYTELAQTISVAGLFDAITVLSAQKQTIEEANLLEVEPITDEGKEDQEWAHTVTDQSSSVWKRKRKMMELIREKAAEEFSDQPAELSPFILDKTVEFKDNDYVPKAA